MRKSGNQAENIEKTEENKMDSGSRIAQIVMAAVAIILVLRLFTLQIIQTEVYKGRATGAQWTSTTLHAMRGTIYASGGTVLAQSAITWDLYVIPERIPNENKRAALAADLARTFELDEDEVKEKLAVKEQTDPDKPVIAHKVLIKSNLELAEKRKVECDKGKEDKYYCDENGNILKDKNGNNRLKGDAAECIVHRGYEDYVTLEESSKRYYPMGDFASSLLGFTDKEGKGKYGVEAYYNDELAGFDGKKTSYGTYLDDSNSKIYPAQDGSSLVLTIDETVQGALEEQVRAMREASAAIGGYGIVQDVKTGAILGLACDGYKGSYDLNNPDEISPYYERLAERYSENDNFEALEEYSKYNEEHEKVCEEIMNTESFEERKALHSNRLRFFFKMEQWNNYAVSETYHPGSVFKIFLAAAAVEEHALPDDFRSECWGSIRVDDRVFNCHKEGGHGRLNLADGLKQSCNPCFIRVGQELGRERFFKYFKAFGFTEKTGIECVGESSPIYFKEEDLTRVTLASESFGQTFSITPIQLITAISSIANGGKLMQPYLVDKFLDSEGNVISTTKPKVRRQVISEETAKTITTMMERVCEPDGTGRNARVAGYRVAGKTGTSQKYQVRGTYIASFGCFAPADDPRIAILLIADEPDPSNNNYNGSTVCAPYSAKLTETILEYLGVERQYSEEEMAQLDTFTPGVIGRDIDEAEDSLENEGFSVRVIGSGDTVLSQSPASGQTIPRGGVIALYTTNDEDATVEVTVPDLTGMSASEVRKVAAYEGINVRINGYSGSGNISFDQNTEAGSSVEYGTIVTVYFKSGEVIRDG